MKLKKKISDLAKKYKPCLGIYIYICVYAMVFVPGEACDNALSCDPDRGG